MEVTRVPDAVGLRDSKHGVSPIIALTPAEWASFAVQIKAGDHDL